MVAFRAVVPPPAGLDFRWRSRVLGVCEASPRCKFVHGLLEEGEPWGGPAVTSDDVNAAFEGRSSREDTKETRSCNGPGVSDDTGPDLFVIWRQLSEESLLGCQAYDSTSIVALILVATSE